MATSQERAIGDLKKALARLPVLISGIKELLKKAGEWEQKANDFEVRLQKAEADLAGSIPQADSEEIAVLAQQVAAGVEEAVLAQG